MTELDGYPLDVEFDALFARETMPAWLSLAVTLWLTVTSCVTGLSPLAKGKLSVSISAVSAAPCRERSTE